VGEAEEVGVRAVVEEEGVARGVEVMDWAGVVMAAVEKEEEACATKCKTSVHTIGQWRHIRALKIACLG
jgi:hypothetical protein